MTEAIRKKVDEAADKRCSGRELYRENNLIRKDYDEFVSTATYQGCARVGYKEGAKFICKEYAVLDKALLEEVEDSLVEFTNLYKHEMKDGISGAKLLVALSKLKAARSCDD